MKSSLYPLRVASQVASLVSLLCITSLPALHAQTARPLTGQAAFTDYSEEKPGVVRDITLADLPAPYATKGVDNGAEMVSRPNGAWPQALPGFKVDQYYTGLDQPRLIVTAPNGDLFVAISYQNKIMVFRGVDANGKPKQVSTFADNLSQPFGIAFYPLGPNPKYVYIGNTDSVVRFPYKNGDMKATGPAEKLADLPGGGRLRGGGHWTRDIVFSKDGQRMFVSVGSHSNDDDSDTHPEEFHRADVLEFTPEGKFVKIYASASATASARPSIPPPASSGARPTSATCSATTSFPTTSPTCRKAASTAGPGTTWEARRTRASKASTPS